MAYENINTTLSKPNDLVFDNDSNRQLLFQHFCNNLYLGQWELARACIEELNLECHGLDKSISSVLKDIARQPFNKW
jgi:hypothetical protein